ncbi:MAG: hypothetical protein V7785_21945 [Bermanella sp.]
MFKCKQPIGIKELVSRRVFEDRGEKAWALLDERALKTLDQLREKFGPITINDWSWGGSNEYRGFREPDCKIGAGYSQHRFGRAFDCQFNGVSAFEVRKQILSNPQDFPFITSLEMNVSWLHFDVRNYAHGILKFNP